MLKMFEVGLRKDGSIDMQFDSWVGDCIKQEEISNILDVEHKEKFMDAIEFMVNRIKEKL